MAGWVLVLKQNFLPQIRGVQHRMGQVPQESSSEEVSGGS